MRASLFYSLCLLLLVTVGVALQAGLKLVGIVLYEGLLFLGLAVAFAVYADGGRLRELFRLRRLTGTGVAKSVVLGVVAWALVQTLGILIVLVVQRLGGTVPETYQQLRDAPFWLAILVGAVVPAICEEVAFRGYIQWGLRPLGPVAGAVTTGLLFGFMHLSLIRLIPLATLGVIFAIAVQRSGSLLVSMIMHFLNNTIALTLAFYYKPSEQSASPLGPGSSVAGLLLLLVAAAALGIAAWALARSFGPEDTAVPTPGRAAGAPMPALEQVAAARAESPGQTAHSSWAWPMAAALIPAALLYLWLAANELVVVFGKK